MYVLVTDTIHRLVDGIIADFIAGVKDKVFVCGFLFVFVFVMFSEISLPSKLCHPERSEGSVF